MEQPKHGASSFETKPKRGNSKAWPRPGLLVDRVINPRRKPMRRCARKGQIWWGGGRERERAPHLAVADALADAVGLLAVVVVAGRLHRARPGPTDGWPPRRAEQLASRARAAPMALWSPPARAPPTVRCRAAFLRPCPGGIGLFLFPSGHACRAGVGCGLGIRRGLGAEKGGEEEEEEARGLWETAA